MWIEVGWVRGGWGDVLSCGKDGEGARGDVANTAFYAKLGSIQGPFRVLCRRMDPAGASAGLPAGAAAQGGELEGYDEHGSGATAQVLRGAPFGIPARLAPARIYSCLGSSLKTRG